ncbi:MAG TPA: radical SAM protein [Desulfotignum sp.]|nr:radical SAM protein [Desulfotignum sp.]
MKTNNTPPVAGKEIIRRTFSVCPVCLKRIPACHFQTGDAVFMEKECPAHGFFSTPVWRNHVPITEWIGDVPEIRDEENLDCPHACGLCPDHQRETCCVLLEVTGQCNLHCRFCFADAAPAPAPLLATVKGWLEQLAVPGKTLVQLSGGEPTVRDDLPDIIRHARQAGCAHVQLNTNGIRLGQDKAYIKELADAGLSFVFLQFDGMDDDIYQTLRGKPLLDIKKKAVAYCGECGIGVTLVPTLVPDVNVHQIGAIIDYGISLSPWVRGVHFQPVSYFGRIPQMPSDRMRLTLDQLMAEIETQTGGRIAKQHLLSSRFNHPLCKFHGDFVILPDSIMPLSHPRDRSGQCCDSPVTVDQNRAFITRRWKRPEPDLLFPENCTPSRCCPSSGNIAPSRCCNPYVRTASREKGSPDMPAQTPFPMQPPPDSLDLDYFMNRVRTHGFTLTAMAFQDAGNLDLERLRRCSLHVFDNGRFVPFCAYYLSGWQTNGGAP